MSRTTWRKVDGDVSVQPIWGDIFLEKTAGGSTATTPRYLVGVMGNVLEETLASGLTATANMIAGVIGKNDIQGAISSTWPSAGVVGEVGDKSVATYAVLAVMGGDTGSPKPVAMFGVDWHNSTAATEADFGLDLQGNGTHNSFKNPHYSKGQIRLGGRVKKANGAIVEGGDDVVIRTSEVAPVDGTSGTGAGDTGIGSILVNTGTGKWYRNEGTKASPTWVLFSTA